MVRSFASSWCARFLDTHRSGFNFSLLFVGYALYVVIGAGIFSAIELPFEKELRKDLIAAWQEFLNNHSCVSEARLEEFLFRALDANSYGVSILKDDNKQKWDFVSSLFFTSTVLTTTGYGHTVPLSDGGKAFCICYTLIGIPITLFFISVAVQRLMVLVSRRPVSYFHRRWAFPKPKLAAIHATCLAIIVFLFLVIVPAGIFKSLEKDWNYLDSLYFCFISLTTIGLGDYVPGETHSTAHNPHPQLYRLAITVYLLLGLVCVLVVMETCYELPQTKRFRQRFYQESVRDLDSETTNIIDREHSTDNSVHHEIPRPPDIPSVLEQVESMRQGGISSPYTRATGNTVNKPIR